jgi:shikimate dehydrogenase
MPIDGADRYAVFGNPVGHSLSPRIHAMFAQQTGQDMIYTAICPPLDGFAAAVAAFAAQGGRGANVTVPFKEQAFRLAQNLTPRAQAAGAVNTLSFAQGEISGDNTDGAGLVRDITVNLGRGLRGARILILGAGGAARGVILPLLAWQPASIFIANRTAEKAARLAADFQVNGGGFAALANQTFDLVINATSAGLSNAVLPTPALCLPCTPFGSPAGTFASGALAYEMLYGRATPFMQSASAAGAQVADGLGMLVEQAAEAFFVWRGVRPQTAPVLAELRASPRAALSR